jgi:hypothetical protein
MTPTSFQAIAHIGKWWNVMDRFDKFQCKGQPMTTHRKLLLILELFQVIIYVSEAFLANIIREIIPRISSYIYHIQKNIYMIISTTGHE